MKVVELEDKQMVLHVSCAGSKSRVSVRRSVCCNMRASAPPSALHALALQFETL